jgi:ABC-type Fe3+-siderophore transport system permease subunit
MFEDFFSVLFAFFMVCIAVLVRWVLFAHRRHKLKTYILIMAGIGIGFLIIWFISEITFNS